MNCEVEGLSVPAGCEIFAAYVPPRNHEAWFGGVAIEATSKAWFAEEHK